jgi:MFS family permease
MGGSAAGDLAAQAALTLRLHAETGTGTAVSALLLANTLPVLVCVPVAGRLADRVDSRRLLVGCSLACGALCVGLAAARPTWLVLALVAAVAAVSAVTAAGLGALVPVMAGPGGLVRANTALRGTVMVMSVAGLAVGGVGSQWLGTGPVLLLDAVSFGAVAIGAAVLRARRAGGRPVSRTARRDRGADTGYHPAGPLPRWTVAGGYAAVLLLVSTTNVAQVFFVKDTLGAGDLGYGLVSACWALGTLLALPLVKHTRPDPDLLARLTIVGMSATGVALFGCGALGDLVGTAALYVLGGAAACVMQVARGTYVQLTADPEHRGRQLARYNAVTKAASVGALLLGGPLVDAVGGRATYVLAGSAAAAVAGIAALAWVRVGARMGTP